MKKLVFSMFLMGCAVEAAHAGGMGDVSSSQDYFVPFAIGEASATWNTIKSATVFDRPPSTHFQHWGGRGGFGLTHLYQNHVGYTAELGWGYYGSTSSYSYGTIPSGALTITNNGYLYGLDILIGLSYDVDKYRLFVKAGALAENRHSKGYALFRNGIGVRDYVSTNSIYQDSTNVLPEIKVGGIYNFNDHIGFSLAYMHVFGNNSYASKVTGAFANPQATAGISSVVSAQNPTLNSIMFGLVYNFV